MATQYLCNLSLYSGIEMWVMRRNDERIGTYTPYEISELTEFKYKWK
jgi:hypothetical protein